MESVPVDLLIDNPCFRLRTELLRRSDIVDFVFIEEVFRSEGWLIGERSKKWKGNRIYTSFPAVLSLVKHQPKPII